MLAPMRRAALVLIAVGLVLPASAYAERTGRVLVSLAEPAPGHARMASATAVVARAGAGRPEVSVPQVGLIAVRPRAGESTRVLARRLRRDPAVRAVDAEHRATPRAVPNDPVFAVADPSPAAGGQSLAWWAVRSNFPEAWDLSDGAGVTVAIIDQGVDTSHPDLAPKIRRTVDLDADPRHGAPTVDETGHGTHVASLACAQPNNATGLAGAGYGCGLIVEKSDLSDSSVVQAIIDATDNGAGVISMSIGTDDRAKAPRAIVDAVDYAFARDVVLVAAAADKQTIQQGDPANLLQPTGTGSDINAGKGLSVTAAGFDGRRAPFAGDGSQISLAAYGAFDRPGPDGVLGAFPAAPNEIETGTPTTRPCHCRGDLVGDTRYAFLAGTSMATPIVAGAAALVRDLNPDLTASEVIRVLKLTAQRPEGIGWTPDVGWGIVDAGAAVRTAAALDRRPPTSSVTAPATTRRRTVALRITATDTAAPGVAVAGVRTVRVYRSVDGRRPRRIGSTAGPVLRVPVTPGTRNTFYTQAVDRAGNRENAPTLPDARTRADR
jgi:serine protease